MVRFGRATVNDSEMDPAVDARRRGLATLSPAAVRATRGRAKEPRMITKFSTVYAGHIDLGDMGQRATPANERRYTNDQLAGVFAKTDAIARVMDDHGFNTLWLAEHHFQHEGYECIPNI